MRLRSKPTRPGTGSRLVLAALCATALVAAGCSSDSDTTANGSGDGSSSESLVVYSGQHEDLTKELAKAFEKETSIKIDVRAGDDAELTNQIAEEGDRSKADVILTEEPGPIGQLDSKNMLAPVDASSLDKVDKRFVPSSGNWLPWAGRSRAMFYNPNLISESDLPRSILDLTDSKWKGRFAYAPSGAFTTTVTYLINTIGEDKTLDWLKAIKENGINEQKNGKVRDSVEAGQHEFGLSNHYYWYILAKEKGGPDALQSKVHYVKGEDAGGLLLASGAGILKSSKNQDAAQKFLSWLVEKDGGQTVVVEDTPQYPMVDGLESSYGIEQLGDLEPPTFDQGSLVNIAAAKDLMIKAGIV